MTLDDIVTLTETSNGTSLAIANYDTIALLVGIGAPSVEVATYKNLSDVETDFGKGSQAYLMAYGAFRQSPRPKKIKIISANVAVEQSIDIDVLAASNGKETSITLTRPDGTTATYTHTADGADTTTTIAADMVTLINAGESALTASSSGATITLEPDVDGKLYYYSSFENLGNYVDQTADPGYGDVLDSAMEVDSDFYFVLPDVSSEDIVLALAEWAELNKKGFVPQTVDDAEAASARPIGSALVTGEYKRTFPIYHPAEVSSEYQNVRHVTRMSAYQPGSATWYYKSCEGTTANRFTSAQEQYLLQSNYTFYASFAGTGMTEGGKNPFGEFIHIRHGTDYAIAVAQHDLASMIVASPRIPYTKSGLQMIGDQLLASFNKFTTPEAGLLIPGSVQVSVPDFADVDSSDRESGTLRNVVVTARYQGAVKYVEGIQVTFSF